MLHCGDCLDVMTELEENSIDSVITDPPYGLGKQPDIFKVLEAWINDKDVDNGGGFMGKKWDSFVPGPHYWKAVYRVMKPGGIALVFGGTRTYDLTTLALRMAGFEIRDCVMWLQGQGFPKSHAIGKAIDRKAGKKRKVVGRRPIAYPDSNCWGVPNRNTMEKEFSAPNPMDRNNGKGIKQSQRGIITTPATTEAELWEGYGTALKPAWEPIIVAMKPRDGTFANNALTHGVAGFWIDGCRIGSDIIDVPQVVPNENIGTGYTKGWGAEWTGEIKQHQGRFPANLILSHTAECKRVGTRQVKGTNSSSDRRSKKAGYEGGWTVGVEKRAASGLEEIESWECSPDCPVAMLDRQSGISKSSKDPNRFMGRPKFNGTKYASDEYSLTWQCGPAQIYGDIGGASRFFYCAKASTKERNEGLEEKNIHPTVKPIELLRYLCRLTKTPTGGIVLDPFMGSGSTGVAAMLEGREFVGIEMEPEYFEIAKQRVNKGRQLALI